MHKSYMKNVLYIVAKAKLSMGNHGSCLVVLMFKLSVSFPESPLSASEPCGRPIAHK